MKRWLQPPRERVLFLHIPKTAGMSLYAALERWAGRDRSIRFGRGGADDLAQYLAVPTERFDRLRLLSGHLTLAEFRQRPLDGWMTITLLRSPVERMLSTYTFIVQTRQHPWHARVAGQTVDEFIEQFVASPANIDQQCLFVAGKRDANAAFSVLTGEFALAAPVEELARFSAALGTILGSSLRVGHRNASHSPLSESRVSARTIELIRGVNVQDEALYQMVRERGLVGSLA